MLPTCLADYSSGDSEFDSVSASRVIVIEWPPSTLMKIAHCSNEVEKKTVCIRDLERACVESKDLQQALKTASGHLERKNCI